MKNALKKIKCVAMDVDGVLTDGRIIMDSNGVETKNFDVQDGLGIVDEFGLSQDFCCGWNNP